MIDNWRDWLPYWPWALALGMAMLTWWGETRRVLSVRRWFRRGALERAGWKPTPRTLTTVLGIMVVLTGAQTVAGWQDEPSGTRWLLIDQSRSQAAVEPGGLSRWQLAQPVLQAWVAPDRRPVAVIVFRNEASVLVPPTRDRQSVLQTLSTLRPILDRQGSDPAAAVRLYGRLRHAGDTALVISDGEWAVTPGAAPVQLIGWGLGQDAPVPALPGDPATPLSRPNPEALRSLCAGHSLWGAGVTAADLDRLEEGAADSSRIGAMLFLLLALLEAGLVIVQRYQVRVGQLPYRWVQRWVLWRAGTAAVLVLVMLLPAASDVPAWRWRSQTSPAREAYNTGCQAADAGDAAAAERAWRRAVALDPGWQPAWFNLGTLLATQPGRQQEALQAMARAMQLDPADLWAKENHATLRAAMQAGHHPVVAILPSPSPIPDAQSSAAGSRTEGGHAPGADQTKGSGSGMAEVAGEMRDLASRLLPGVSDVMAWTERGQGHPSEVQPSGGLQPGAGTGRAEQDAPAGSGGTPDLRNVDLSSLKKGQGGQPQPLPSLRPQDVDRLLGQAENLSEKALQHLQAQQDGQAPTGQLPSLTPEQWARMAALAARMGVQAQDLQQRDDPTSPYVEPAKPSRSTLHW